MSDSTPARRTLGRRPFLLQSAALAALGCGNDEGAAGDGSVLDGSMMDSSVDVAPSDHALVDLQARDAVLPDEGRPDEGAMDGGMSDVGAPDAGPTGAFQLEEAFFTPAKMPMDVVAPRPMAELSELSVYRYAYAGVRYERPVAVRGGAWPFHYELLRGPMGMRVGAFLEERDGTLERTPDYGVVQWTPPEGSDGDVFDVAVRVTDQEGNALIVEWRIEVDRTRFVFVAPAGSPGDGTREAPLVGFEALYGSAGDTRFAGRIAVFRGGDYTLVGDPEASGNVRLSGGTSPTAWLAFPDETPVFDCRRAKIVFTGGNGDDMFFGGLTFDGGRQDVNNAHFIWANTRFDRGVFWRNHFRNLERGQVGNDNPAAIFISGGPHRRHIAIVSNVFENMGPGGGNGVAGYDTFALDESLFEDNTARGCRSTHCFWLKGGHRRVTVRGETLVDGNAAGTVLLNVSLGRDGRTERSENVEVSHCRTVSEGRAFAMRTVWASSANETGPLWVYRCSVGGRFGALHRDEADVTYERCLSTEGFPTGETIRAVESEIVGGGDFDGAMRLVGAARERLIGTHGAEIAARFRTE